jgi:septal ring factor EnvC (AmiA/AmiB activator)
MGRRAALLAFAGAAAVAAGDSHAQGPASPMVSSPSPTVSPSSPSSPSPTVPSSPAGAASPSTPATPTPAATLQALRDELRAKQAALADLSSRERSLVEGLGELDESLSRLDDDVYAAQRRLRQLTTEIGTLERTTGRDEAELAVLRARLRARLRQLAVDGEGGAARALLGAEGFTELALRRRFLAQLANNDSKLTTDVRRVEDSVARQRAELRDRLAEAQRTQSLLSEQQALLAATRDERARTLERMRGERDVLRKAALDLVGKHRELQVLMNRIVDEPRAPAAVAPRGGILRDGLLWPAAEGVVIRRFGSTVDQDTRAEIVCNGVELRSAPDTPVYAVAAGRVVHTGWLRGFGRVVIVDHGEGHHTLYAHLARADVAVGDEVARGAQIAAVGDTESQNGPKLYFELREHGRPRDPAPFLRR